MFVGIVVAKISIIACIRRAVALVCMVEQFVASILWLFLEVVVKGVVTLICLTHYPLELTWMTFWVCLVPLC